MTWDDYHHKVTMTQIADQDIVYWNYIRKPKGKLLDIGCGQGSNLRYFIERNLDCYGIDFCKVALEKIDFPAKLYCNDILNMPFEDNYFDCAIDVVTLASLSIDKLDLVFKEINRVLKRKGKLFIKELTDKNDINNRFFKRDKIMMFDIKLLVRLLDVNGFRINGRDITGIVRQNITHYIIHAEKI